MHPRTTVTVLDCPHSNSLIHSTLTTPTAGPLIILQRASTVQQSSCSKTISTRQPLASSKVTTTSQISRILSTFNVHGICSSSSLHYLSAIQPFTRTARTAVTHRPLLDRRNFSSSPATTLGHVSRVLKSPTPTIVYARQPILPRLLRRVTNQLKLDRVPSADLSANRTIVFRHTRSQIIIRHIRS